MLHGAPGEGAGAGRVVLVAGATGVGKTTLIAELRDGGGQRTWPAALPDVRGWTTSTARDHSRLRRRKSDDAAAAQDVLLHFDISQLTLPGDVRKHRVRRLSRVLAAAAELHVLTLWAPPGVLLDRVDRRIDERTRARPDGRRIVPVRRSMMEDDEHLAGLYRTWFDFVARFEVLGSWVVESSTPTGPVEPESTWTARHLQRSS